jgi:hypothetical protein
MRTGRTTFAAAVMLFAPAPAAAQHPTVPMDSARAELRTTLRAFYFNLAHRDWEALAAQVLSAKVMASHPVPERLLTLAAHVAPTDPSAECSSAANARVDHATIALDGDWAGALVPHCPPAPTARADEFRLVRFERRWRIIYIDLFQDPGAVQLAR